MKKEFEPMSWLVTNFDCNAQKITYYDVLKYREDDIKKMKKTCDTKEEFASALKSEMQYRFWSKAEYELIIRLTEDGKVILRPWCGCRNEDEAEIYVRNNIVFDWVSFAEHHIGKQIYKNEAKIDIYDQLQWQWDAFVDYCWNYRHKYQRKHLGGARRDEI